MTAPSAHCSAFQKHLKSLGVSAYWVNHIPDLFYLSGFGAEGCWGLIGARRAMMLVPGLALDQARAIAKGFDVQSVKKASDAYGVLVDYAVAQGWKRVGYDPYRTPEAYINGLRKVSGRRVQWIAVPSATLPIRIKKDRKEVRALREAGRLVAEGFAHIKKIAKPGMRECDLAADFESYIRKHGATKPSFD